MVSYNLFVDILMHVMNDLLHDGTRSVPKAIIDLQKNEVL